MSFDQTRVDQYVGTGRPVNHYRRRGTGLATPGLLNGREAEPWELEVQQRAYARLREQADELLDIRPSRG